MLNSDRISSCIMDLGVKLRWGLHELRKSWKLSLVVMAGFLLLFIAFATSTSSQSIYKVVLDAGSTGTRVHVFHFKSPKFALRSGEIRESDLDLISIPLFAKIQGGLSEFSDNPKACRPGLMDLMNQARNVVPREFWEDTEVILMATAGLRLLRPDQADALLSEARGVLSRSGFQLGTVDTIDGKLEAKLMFTMTHFVINSDDHKKMAIVDLGGGSVQLAYKDTNDFIDMHPDISNEIQAYLEKSKRSTLYLHSWLGYGLVAFRLKALEMISADLPHPCVPEWTPLGTSYRYGEKEVPVIPRKQSGDNRKPVQACLELIRSAVSTSDNEGTCKVITMSASKSHTQCGITGSWLGPSEPNSISEWRLFSYIFDLAQAEGLVAPDASDGSLSANDFLHAAESHCQATSTPTMPESGKLEWWKCIDLVYVSALLTDGFKLDPNFPLQVTKHLIYKGEIELEAAWPLGAAIAAIRNEL